MATGRRAKVRPDGTCERCNQVHPRAACHRSNGQPCMRYPTKGMKVCCMHGARGAKARRAAAERIAQDKAAAIVARLVNPREVDPGQALLELIYWTAGEIDLFQSMVQQLDPGDLIWGTTEVRDKTGGEDWGTTTTKRAQAHAWHARLVEAMTRQKTYVVAALNAGIEERRTRLAERQGQQMAQVFRLVFEDLRLSPEQQALVPTVLPRRLRELRGMSDT